MAIEALVLRIEDGLHEELREGLPGQGDASPFPKFAHERAVGAKNA